MTSTILLNGMGCSSNSERSEVFTSSQFLYANPNPNTDGESFISEETRVYEIETTYEPRRQLRKYTDRGMTSDGRYSYGNVGALGSWWSSKMGQSGNNYSNGSRRPYTPGDYL